jgi:hypothetical protein
MQYSCIRKLLAIELTKLSARFNILYLIIIHGIVWLQVFVAVKMEQAMAAHPYAAEDIMSVAERFVNNIAYTFIPVLFLINLSREFEYGIVHRMLVSGQTRLQYFQSKLIQLFLLSVVAAISLIHFSVSIAAGFNLSVSWDWGRTLFAFLVPFYLGSITMLFAFMLKKTNYAIILYAAYIVFDNSVSTILQNNGMDIQFPFTMCVRLLDPGIYNAWTFVFMAGSFILFLQLALWKFRKSDLW